MSKDQKIFYKNIDRIIRIIYSELQMTEYIRFTDFEKINYEAVFDLENSVFRKRIEVSYITLYPKNFNYDDLNYLFDFLTEELQREYQSSNVLYLFFYIAKRIINRSNDRLFIEFDNLLEWDGFINKVDVKLFTSAYFVEKNWKQDLNVTSTVLEHNNKYLYDILKRIGLSENHMHLKASGYVEDINWYYFFKESLYNKHQFVTFINSSGTFNDLPKTDNTQKNLILFLQKIKLLRLILYSFNKNQSIFDGLSFKVVERLLLSDDLELTIQALGMSKQIKAVEAMAEEEFKKIYEKADLLTYSMIEEKFLKSIFTGVMKKNYVNRTFLTYLFNLYICGVTRMKFQFVQNNLGMGFSKFKEKEENKAWFIPSDSQGDIDLIRSVFHKYYREKVVKKIEFRIAPKHTKEDYLTFIRTLDDINTSEYNKTIEELKKTGKKESAKQLTKINYGIIIHFIKPKCETAYKNDARNESQREQVDQLSNQLFSYLEYIDKLAEKNWNETVYLNKIVGIDTANYEIGNRPEVFGSIFRKFRMGTSEGRILRATYHVGEEFSTLANGLRAIDETLTFLDYRQNDRLGHALALGIDADYFFKAKRYNIFSSFQDYIDDIAWMYSMISQSAANKIELLCFLKDEYNKYKFELFAGTVFSSNPLDLEDYIDSYYLRGDVPEIYLGLFDSDSLEYNDYQSMINKYSYKVNYRHKQHKRSFMNTKARKLYAHYHYDEQLKKTGAKSLHIEVVESYVACIKCVQYLLKLKILNMNVFIEANPTSNKKISFVNKYNELPALKLNCHLLKKTENFINLPISINTDDSGIFQTNLSNEYSMIAAALIRDHYPEEKVYAYIEQLAIASNVHSFIEE